MTWHIPPITVVVPQLDRWSIGDKISAAIALVTLMAFMVSYAATFMAYMTNKRNYIEAKLQREQSALDSQRTYELMLIQMNRDNRVKLYAPLLAWLRGRWYSFNEDVIALFPELNAARLIPQTHADNLGDLQRRIATFEFETELDLLGTEAIKKTVNDWRDKFHFAEYTLKALLDLNRPEGGDEAIAHFDQDYFASKERLFTVSGELARELGTIKQLILHEIEVPIPDRNEHFGGTAGAQENENR